MSPTALQLQLTAATPVGDDPGCSCKRTRVVAVSEHVFRPPCRAKEAAAVMAEREKFEEQRGQMEEYSRQLNELSRTMG